MNTGQKLLQEQIQRWQAIGMAMAKAKVTQEEIGAMCNDGDKRLAWTEQIKHKQLIGNALAELKKKSALAVI